MARVAVVTGIERAGRVLARRVRRHVAPERVPFDPVEGVFGHGCVLDEQAEQQRRPGFLKARDQDQPRSLWRWIAGVHRVRPSVRPSEP